MQDVKDLRQYLIDVWIGVEQSVIDDGIDQWHKHLHTYIRASRGHFEYVIHCDRIGQNINCDKLLNETFVSDCR